MGVEKSMGSLKLEEREKVCPDCKAEEIVYDNGELYCRKCGLVID